MGHLQQMAETRRYGFSPPTPERTPAQQRQQAAIWCEVLIMPERYKSPGPLANAKFRWFALRIPHDVISYNFLAGMVLNTSED